MGKNKKKSKKNKKNTINYDLLPQNIISVGEHVEEDKRIYINQKVYKEIHRFTEDKTENESGGVLVGNVIDELGKSNIIIRAFIEAKHSEGTPTTLTFTHDSWEYIHRQLDKHYSNLKIVGWIHTHPDFGIFLSEYDKFIQNNFFSEDDQIAYVIDPIQKEEGFYFWINENITKCTGFYIFDEVGSEISVGDINVHTSDLDEEKKIQQKGGFWLTTLLLVLLISSLLLMLVGFISLNKRIKELEKINMSLTEEYNNLFNQYNIQLNRFQKYKNEKESESIEAIKQDNGKSKVADNNKETDNQEKASSADNKSLNEENQDKTTMNEEADSQILEKH